MIKTYKDLLTALQQTNADIFVSIHYVTGTYEWLLLNKLEYIRQLTLIGNPEKADFPCYVEFEPVANNVFIHTLVPNKHSK